MTVHINPQHKRIQQANNINYIGSHKSPNKTTTKLSHPTRLPPNLGCPQILHQRSPRLNHQNLRERSLIARHAIIIQIRARLPFVK